MTEVTDIEWGFNCLTGYIHHGRPEKIWNLPLLQTTYMFRVDQIQELAVDRIYNDAMQYVERSPFVQKETGESVVFTQEWADKVKEIAATLVLDVYQKKVDEIAKFYRSPGFRRDVEGVIERNKHNKLNAHYEPLHSHDTLNLLCRIVGTSADHQAVTEIGA